MDNFFQCELSEDPFLHHPSPSCDLGLADFRLQPPNPERSKVCCEKCRHYCAYFSGLVIHIKMLLPIYSLYICERPERWCCYCILGDIGLHVYVIFGAASRWYTPQASPITSMDILDIRYRQLFSFYATFEAPSGFANCYNEASWSVSITKGATIHINWGYYHSEQWENMLLGGPVRLL